MGDLSALCRLCFGSGTIYVQSIRRDPDVRDGTLTINTQTQCPSGCAPGAARIAPGAPVGRTVQG